MSLHIFNHIWLNICSCFFCFFVFPIVDFHFTFSVVQYFPYNELNFSNILLRKSWNFGKLEMKCGNGKYVRISSSEWFNEKFSEKVFFLHEIKSFFKEDRNKIKTFNCMVFFFNVQCMNYNFCF